MSQSQHEEVYEQQQRDAQQKKNANAKLFPPADALRDEVFNLERWVSTNRTQIEKSLKEHGSYSAKLLPNDYSRRLVTEFFTSLGYKVEPGNDYRNETDGSLRISLPTK
jgi:hypothetical protein